MKKFKLYIAAAAALALAAACSDEHKMDTEGQGSVKIAAVLNSDMEVVSRATEQELADGCILWLSNSKGLVYHYEGIDNVPASIPLVTGHYVAEAWAGDSVSASFEKRAFYGREEFDVAAGQTANVSLVCKIANVAASVKYADNIEDVLTNYTMTIGHGRGSLIYEGRDDRRGYFMMPSTDTDLVYELKGTQIDGSAFHFEGKIENAQKATEYVLNVKYTAAAATVGGAMFTIEIDNHEIPVTNTDVTLYPAPKITGYDFTIGTPIVSEPGAVGRRCIYIATPLDFSSILLDCDAFQSIPGLESRDFDIISMNATGKAAVNAAGITFGSHPADDGSIMQINFEEAWTNSLEKGDYTVTITATDTKGKSSTGQMIISVSDAPVMTLEPAADAASYHEVTLRGVVAKDDVETVGFNYAVDGTSDWTFVEGHALARSFAKGTEYVATVKGLKGNTTYKYVAVSDDFVSAVEQRVTTLNDQLPNSGFEFWYKDSDGSAMTNVSASAADMFWDSGNHGSQTMSKNITEQETNSQYVHSGNSSVRLTSQFVGVGTIGKFAAGNIFAGAYLYTAGTDGELGWGRPFTLAPTAVKVWARYEPAAAVNKKGAGDKLAVGEEDTGIIYIALTDDTTTKYVQEKSDYDGTYWPCIIKTASKELFDKAGANVIAYGEHKFEGVTEGNGLVQITIPLDYLRPGVTPSNILFVASASLYGDYFQGGNGSKLWLDDIELVY